MHLTQLKNLIRILKLTLITALVLPPLFSFSRSWSVGLPDANTVEGCVENYDTAVDYFPQKIDIKYATGFKVEYHPNYKVVTILNPWQNAGITFQYVLVQCGTPVPAGFESAHIIKVPIRTLVSMATTHLSHLEKLGVSDKLIGFSRLQYISSPVFIQRIKDDLLTEISSGPNINIEMVLDLQPDLVMTFGVDESEKEDYRKLLEAGIKIVFNSEYLEKSPLGYAEWIKFTSLFFNKEAVAQKTFEDIANRYEELAAIGRKATYRPTVFTGTAYKGSWDVPGGRSYMAAYLADAGANYLWADSESTGKLRLDFESVFEKAANAEFWINTGTWISIKDALTADERYGYFAALKNGRVYNNNARINEHGGNDYWESGITNPHLILADLIKIFHPELLPDHALIWYRPLDPGR